MLYISTLARHRSHLISQSLDNDKKGARGEYQTKEDKYDMIRHKNCEKSLNYDYSRPSALMSGWFSSNARKQPIKFVLFPSLGSGGFFHQKVHTFKLSKLLNKKNC